MKLICQGCGKSPEELVEYVEMAKEEGGTPSEWALKNEGTVNEENGHFLCTPCYADAGCPTAPEPGWKCP